ncbi:hypothetical protein TrLO_g14340 [Triparma laevis f. longispina]|uniref:Tyrosine-protein kinase ephrin type A/B receptor-like domain-containing protein n=1 Tax=Triparma laevis f. longispina TaxID=1714387 RepID=A0A9W6ZR26_9STRA|nr:hypothetical protein TrLO_g14340 [Triparma laevis f. longispina]
MATSAPKCLLLFLLLLVLLPSSIARKGSTNPSQLHKDQHTSRRSANNSPNADSNSQPCPRGKYRKSGLHGEECELCPRGRYGNTEGNTNTHCSAGCPTGRYYDLRGAKSEDDCLYCPPGKYGTTTGLKTAECSGSCVAGKYSSVSGLSTDTGCTTCLEGYRGWQCDHALQPRRGHFVSTDGKIDESAHAYLDASSGSTGQIIGPSEHPDGEWSADRYVSGGTRPGAYPDGADKLPGRVAGGGDAEDARTNFDPAQADRATIDKVP